MPKPIAWENNSYKVMLLTSRKDEATLRFYRRSGLESSVKIGFVAYNREYIRRRASRKGKRGVPDDEGSSGEKTNAGLVRVDAIAVDDSV